MLQAFLPWEALLSSRGYCALREGRLPTHCQNGPRLAKNVSLSPFRTLMPPLGAPTSPPPPPTPSSEAPGREPVSAEALSARKGSGSKGCLLGVTV